MRAAAALLVSLSFALLAGKVQGAILPPPPPLPPPPTNPAPTPPLPAPPVPLPPVPAPPVQAPPLPAPPVKPPPVSAPPIPPAPAPVPPRAAPPAPAPAPSPPATAPLPAVPKLPAPAVPAPAKPGTPAAPAAAVPASVSQVSPRVSRLANVSRLSPNPLSSSSASGTSILSGSSSNSAGASFAPQRRSQVKSFQISRPWISTTGAKRKRSTTLTFALRHAGRVVFTVKQVSPGCQTIARFVVHGHKGINRIRFAGRLRGKQLGAGTYWISARTPSGRSVTRLILVVVNGTAPTKAEVASARAANVCSSTRGFASTSNWTGASNLAVVPGTAATHSAQPKGRPSALGAPQRTNGPSGVLASTVEKTARAIRPALVALLVMAIILLALAALPSVAFPDPRLNDLIARHRVEIAGVGAAAFVAVVISFLVA